MKKRLILSAFAFFLVIGVIAYVAHYYEEKTFFEKQEQRVAKYIHHNLKNVKSITFTDRSNNPFVGPRISGYINNNKTLTFDVSVFGEDFGDHLFYGGELETYIKLRSKSITEIEKEEMQKGYKEKQEHYFTEQKKRIRKYIEGNFKGITAVTFREYGTTDHHTAYVNGYFNHKKENVFRVLLNDDEMFESQLETDHPKIEEMRNKHDKTISEIEKEQRQKGHKEEEERYFAQQMKRVQKYVRYNTKGFQSVTYTRYGRDAKGHPYINGYLNYDDGLGFKVRFSKGNFENQLKTDTLAAEELFKLDLKSVSDIEKH
ncbi:hypothetical protein A374_19310 [Fictibacillus macauensis ZFHKF-1]|uniref:DUF1433 domain-containing protein n=1 Tax=Fictibacillus macauensis ZFHKF-1 TaxID=1196324 RepID=I8U9R7_9BACL|nr:DUF1433 domain-containing protein [Fictibacillus macauensis]EIT83700.1 hypothetical protein A374_19310 [Fictibacillus macauensis ZFHKF-1]